MTERGHTLLVAEEGRAPVGVVVFFEGEQIQVTDAAPESGSFDSEAFARGLAVLHVATANPLEFFFDESTLDWVASEIEDTLEISGLRNIPVFFAGLSLAGTRALRFSVYLNSAENHWLKASGVAVVDAPLDMERFWREGKAASRGVSGADLPHDHPFHDLFLDFYEEMNIPEDFYWFTLQAAPPSEIHWMTRSEIERYGLITR